MSLTFQQEQELRRLRAKFAPEQEPERDSLTGRAVKRGINLIPEIAQNYMDAGAGIAGFLSGSDIYAPDSPHRAEIPKLAIPEAETLGEAVVDGGSYLAEILGTAVAPMPGVATIGRGAGLSQKASQVAASGVGWALGGSDMGPDVAAVEGSLGAMQRATDFLPRAQRTGLAVASGVGAGLFYGATEGWKEGIALGIANLAMPFLPRNPRIPGVAEPPALPAPAQAQLTSPVVPLQLGDIPTARPFDPTTGSVFEPAPPPVAPLQLMDRPRQTPPVSSLVEEAPFGPAQFPRGSESVVDSPSGPFPDTGTGNLFDIRRDTRPASSVFQTLSTPTAQPRAGIELFDSSGNVLDPSGLDPRLPGAYRPTANAAVRDVEILTPFMNQPNPAAQIELIAGRSARTPEQIATLQLQQSATDAIYRPGDSSIQVMRSDGSSMELPLKTSGDRAEASRTLRKFYKDEFGLHIPNVKDVQFQGRVTHKKSDGSTMELYEFYHVPTGHNMSFSTRPTAKEIQDKVKTLKPVDLPSAKPVTKKKSDSEKLDDILGLLKVPSAPATPAFRALRGDDVHFQNTDWRVIEEPRNGQAGELYRVDAEGDELRVPVTEQEFATLQPARPALNDVDSFTVEELIQRVIRGVDYEDTKKIPTVSKSTSKKSKPKVDSKRIQKNLEESKGTKPPVLGEDSEVLQAVKRGTKRARGRKNISQLGGDSEQGFIANELTRALAFTGLGVATGATAPILTDGEISLAEGMVAGGFFGAFGPVMVRRLLLNNRPVKHPARETPARPTFRTPDGPWVKTKSGRTSVRVGSEGLGERYSRLFSEGKDWMERLGEAGRHFHATPLAKTVAWLEKEFFLNRDASVKAMTALARGKGIEYLSIAQEALEKLQRSKLTRMANQDSRLHRVANEYIDGKITAKQFREAFPGEQYTDYYTNLVAMREALDGMQKLYASGFRTGSKREEMIAKSVGAWVTRAYRMFHDPKYRPTQQQIDKVAQAMVDSNRSEFVSFEVARNLVEDYLHKVLVNRGSLGRGSRKGEKLDAGLIMSRNDKLSEEFRAMMGEYTDPVERLFNSTMKLSASATSAKFFDLIDNMVDTAGLSLAFTRKALDEELRAIGVRMTKTSDPQELATLQRQKRSLESYRPLDDSQAYGKLAGKLVNRHVFDEIATYETVWGESENAFMRNLTKFHNMVKIQRTAFNPITVVRNYLSVPVFMAIGRGEFKDLPQALKLARGKNLTPAEQALRTELIQQNVITADIVRGELYEEASFLFDGTLDSTLAGRIYKKGIQNTLEVYRTADTLIRSTIYTSAKRRFAKSLDLPETDMQVINAARNHMDKYSMNYAAIAPIFKTARQLPFVNLFISYTSEMARIGGNLVLDIMNPNTSLTDRLHAMKMVAGLVTIPIGLEAIGRSMLSEKDREDWDRARALAPNYDRSRFKIPLGRQEDGTFKFVDISNIIVSDNYNQMLKALASGDLSALIAANPVVSPTNTPALNIAIEQVTGEEMRSGRSIETPMQRIKSIVREMVPPIAPTGFEFQRLQDSFTRNEEGGLGITNLRTGRSSNPMDSILSIAMGARLGNVDSEVAMRFFVKDYEQRVLNERRRMMQVLASNRTDAQKQIAVERFQRRSEAIMLEMMERLDGV